MVESYTNNPKFGDAKKFQSELESASHNVQVLESDLHAVKTKLKVLEEKLDSPKLTTTTCKMENSPLASRSDSIHSSSSSNSDNVSSGISELKVEENMNMKPVTVGALYSTTTTPTTTMNTVVALYSFDDNTIGNSVAMEIGEQFVVTAEDDEGWTKVKRKSNQGGQNEGYVPTAYLKFN